MMNSFVKSKMALFLLLFLTIASCKKDDDTTDPGTNEVAASFQFDISATNFLEVAFTNFSANATSYTWDFGDTNTSTEEAPTHVYDAAGTYTVVLTASDGTSSKTQSKDVVLVDPNVESTILAGTSSKKWYLQREGIALGIGPAVNDNAWWSFGGVTPLGNRPCILDDAFTFHADGTVEFESNGTIWIDLETNGGWLGPNGAEDCYDESDPATLMSSVGDDLSAFGDGGDYTYDYDQGAGTLTVSGDGFYVGLANKTADGDNFIPLAEKTYQVFKAVQGTIADSIGIALSNGGDSWNFYLVSYHDENDLPDIPGAGPGGTDLPDETPTELFNTFASDGATDVKDLVATTSAVTLTTGVDDPAAGTTKVGQYVRGTAEAYADLKFQLEYDAQLTNFTTVSIEVYFPSSNDYSGELSQQVDIFIADASEDMEFWTTWELYVDDTQTAMDQWVTITHPLGNALTRADLDLIGLKIGGENHNVDGTFYIRNFKFE